MAAGVADEIEQAMIRTATADVYQVSTMFMVPPIIAFRRSTQAAVELNRNNTAPAERRLCRSQ